MFHSWGLEVEGADLNPVMIRLCRRRFGESDTLRWVERSFDQPPEKRCSFDAVICVGNSLSLASDHATVERALVAMIQALRPGGVSIIQVLNLWHLPEGPTVRQKCKRVTLDGQDRILLKGIHRIGAKGYIDLIDLTLADEEVTSRFDERSILGLETTDLKRAAQKAGVTEVQFFGTYDMDTYYREQSPDLVLVCRRA